MQFCALFQITFAVVRSRFGTIHGANGNLPLSQSSIISFAPYFVIVLSRGYSIVGTWQDDTLKMGLICDILGNGLNTDESSAKELDNLLDQFGMYTPQSTDCVTECVY